MMKLNIANILLFIITVLILIFISHQSYSHYTVEPFTKLIDATRNQYNKRKRELRCKCNDTTSNMIPRINRVIRNLGF
jgi:hypothetical protein